MNDTITLSRADYEAMVERIEDLEDQLDLLRFERRIEAVGFAEATKDALDIALVDRLVAGESPVRIWREHRGLSAKALADKARISPPYLSEIEAGRKPGSAAALAALAKALEIGMEMLVR
ncbi:MAG TPA: helix-turn-helix transcriptional regulator [Stellaceae bacterium]|nr:helix-turn-helix transcriptional regulator [Stellaceae bacterium]